MTHHQSSTFISLITKFLEERLLPTTHIHGVLVDVLGVGVLLLGKSGIGKSECALDLVIRGHRLVADDIIYIKKKMPAALVGQAGEAIQHHMEIRGLGIINVKDLYGVSSIRDKKIIDMVLELMEWDPDQEYDRLGIDDQVHTILGVELPHLKIPVRPGRNLTSIIEVAARNFLLKGMGYHSARNFTRSSLPVWKCARSAMRWSRCGSSSLSGMSGSGKSTAVRALEDEGFFCLDNLPVALFPTFVELVEKSEDSVRDVALVMDIRGRDFLEGYEGILQQIREAGHSLEILFFTATDEVLIRRFSETRRRHPALDNVSVPEGIRFEREQLDGLRRLSTFEVDTSELNVHQLRERVIAHIRGGSGARRMTVLIQSFGFRYGIPLESDLVMDVRFLPNPFFFPELRDLTGESIAVRKFVLAQQETGIFLDSFVGLLDFLLPAYLKEGKTYLTISIGCTGGKHRSVAIAHEVCERLAPHNLLFKLIHRDIKKG